MLSASALKGGGGQLSCATGRNSRQLHSFLIEKILYTRQATGEIIHKLTLSFRSQTLFFPLPNDFINNHYSCSLKSVCFGRVLSLRFAVAYS